MRRLRTDCCQKVGSLHAKEDLEPELSDSQWHDVHDRNQLTFRIIWFVFDRVSPIDVTRIAGWS
jgi:hypothetical protein